MNDEKKMTQIDLKQAATSVDNNTTEVLFTVALITFNQFQQVLHGIDSVIMQTYPRIQLVIVDDCSCDFDTKHIEEYIEAHKGSNIVEVALNRLNEHQGAAMAYQKALDMAKGEYVLFLSGDDSLMDNDALEETLMCFQKTKAGFLQGRAVQLFDWGCVYLPDEHGFETLRQKDAEGILIDAAMQNSEHYICVNAMPMHTKTLRKIGGFSCAYPNAWDWELLYRILKTKECIIEAFECPLTLKRANGSYHNYNVGTYYIRENRIQEISRIIERMYLPEIIRTGNKGLVKRCRMMLLERERKRVKEFYWFHLSIGEKLAWKLECNWKKNGLRAWTQPEFQMHDETQHTEAMIQVRRQELEKERKEKKTLYLPGVFSIGIVCYRNWQYLKEAIDSVLEQDYGKIQLIVSDDGSKGFPIAEFEAYISNHKKKNVEFLVRQSEKNEGTVRHLNHVLDCACGEYLMVMAADDKLDHPTVMSQYVRSFEEQGEECGAVMSQTALYDEDMRKLEGFFVYPDVEKAIERNDVSNELLNRLFIFPVIPTTSFCCRRWVFDVLGSFDTDYKLIEDYPLHIKIAERHIKMHYEHFIGAKHRDGGISHGATQALSASKRMYFEDCLMARERILERTDVMKEQPQIRSYNRWQRRATQHALFSRGQGFKGKLEYALRQPIDAAVSICRRAKKTYALAGIIVTLLLEVGLYFGKLAGGAAFCCGVQFARNVMLMLTLCVCMMGVVKRIEK